MSDPAAALQRVLDRQGPGVTVLLGAGVLRIARPVHVPDGVGLAGSGLKRTTLLLDRRAWERFSYGFMVTAATRDGKVSAGASLSDLTLNGNRVAVDRIGKQAAGRANQGGGVKLGDDWTVSRVRLTNLNYFKVWAKDASNIAITDNRFDDRGRAKSSGNDMIGGGGVRGARIAGNKFAASARGNAIDFVNSTGLSITGNQVWGTRSVQHGIYLEGVVHSTVAFNVLRHSAISVQSDERYVTGRPAVNPAGIVVARNRVLDAPVQAISIKYDSPARGATRGGGNRVTGNVITRSGTAGIVTMAATSGLVEQPDRIDSNTVTDAFTRSTTTWNNGYGVTRAAGIVIGAGPNTIVTANRVRDTRLEPLTDYGIAIGVANSRGLQVSDVAPTGNTTSRMRIASYYLAP